MKASNLIIKTWLWFNWFLGLIKGQWINLPTNCEVDSQSHQDIYENLCRVDDHRYKILGEDLDRINWLNVGKICTPNPEKSRKVQGKVCQRVITNTQCISQISSDYIIKETKSVKTLTKKECFNHLNEFHESKLINPYYPPPYCKSGETLNNTLIFYQLKEIEGLELPQHGADHYIFPNNYTIEHVISAKWEIMNKKYWLSDYCDINNWDCVGGKLNITIDLRKGISWEDIQYMLLKWDLLYEEPGMFRSIKSGTCMTSYCGHNVIRLTDGIRIKVENPASLPHLPRCNESNEVEIPHRERPGVFSTTGIQYLIKARDEACQEISKRLIRGQPVSWVRLEKLNPLLPGVGFGYGFEEFYGFYGPVTQPRSVRVKGLIRYKCIFTPSLIKYDGKSTYYRPYGHTDWMKYLLNETVNETQRERWDFSDANKDGRTRYGINGIFERDGKITFPWSRFLNILINDINGKVLRFYENLMRYDSYIEKEHKYKNKTGNSTKDDYDYYYYSVTESTIEPTGKVIPNETRPTVILPTHPTVLISKPDGSDKTLFIVMIIIAILFFLAVGSYCLFA
ncbi:non-structural transmembrane protein [Porcine ephemerovirus 1]|uniref:Non-structural transmembrane protein n=1 Tax=Porcine ephemerovirus 1 TaxID=2928256 RepID=A0AAX3AAR7_9RHAB|nr:non-structural transmembrane protein [Porcine ephemerovirus 1]UNP42111.1 non-structural transmembrane protein [Porcine ephemerovirus 1]